MYPHDGRNRLATPCTPLALGDAWSSGAFGSVHVVPTPSGVVAVKRVPESPEHVSRELDVCRRLASDPHPHIVAFVGYWHDVEAPATRVLHLAMEFLPETLAGLLAQLEARQMHMKRWRMQTLMGQLASALAHLESIRLMHRDLKPSNVLVHVSSNRLALADFGSAKFVVDAQPNVTYICTRHYRAPELILDRSLYSTSIDVWAFGCILGEVAKGSPLFAGDTPTDVLSQIMRARGMITRDDVAHMPTHHAEPLHTDGLDAGATRAPRAWSKVLTRRIGDRRVCTSYGAHFVQVLDGCLQWNPSRRLPASAICRHALFQAQGSGKVAAPTAW
jgi:serine/threonine protein kinase